MLKNSLNSGYCKSFVFQRTIIKAGGFKGFRATIFKGVEFYNKKIKMRHSANVSDLGALWKKNKSEGVYCGNRHEANM